MISMRKLFVLGAALASTLYLGAIEAYAAVTLPTTISAGKVYGPYGGSLAASGGTAPYTYAVTSGALPAGLSLDSGTGTVSGTPTTSGSYSFTVQATDATKATASQALSMIIIPTPTQLGLSTPFVIYNNTLEINSNLLDYHGALHAAIMEIEPTCTATSCVNLTQASFDNSAKTAVAQYGTSAMIIFDMESLSLSSSGTAAVAQLRTSALKQYIAWIRLQYPDALVGTYDYDYSTSYCANGAYNSYRKQMYDGTKSGFDFYAPRAYAASSHATWRSTLKASIQCDTDTNPNLPILPFISPVLFPGGTGVSEAEWTAELSDMVACTTPTSSLCVAALGLSATGTYGKIGGTVIWSNERQWPNFTYIKVNPLDYWVADLDLYSSPVVDPSSQYQVRSSNGLCIGSGSSGPSSVACSADESQNWTLPPDTICIDPDGSKCAVPPTIKSPTDTSDGYYGFRSNDGASVWDVVSGALVLSPAGATTNTQLWRTVSLGNGYFQLVNLGNDQTAGTTTADLCLTQGSTLTFSFCNTANQNQAFQLNAIGTPVPLTSYNNVTGITSNGTATNPAGGGLDEDGDTYSTTLLGSALTWNNVVFDLGPPNAPDAVSQKLVELPAGNFSSIAILATGVQGYSNSTDGGQHSQDFIVTYTDGASTTFVQSISDWTKSLTYPNESIAADMSYENTSAGGQKNRAIYLYGYTFALNVAKTVASIQLPNNRHVIVLSAVLLN